MYLRFILGSSQQVQSPCLLTMMSCLSRDPIPIGSHLYAQYKLSAEPSLLNVQQEPALLRSVRARAFRQLCRLVAPG